MIATRWALLMTVAFYGCDIPRDPDGTLARVRGGTLRVGLTENPPWTYANNRVHGVEVELVEAFAESLNAETHWIIDAESDVLKSLEEGKSDLVIGGLNTSNPWDSRVSLTRPYLEHRGRRYVMAVRKGENAWLLELEKFLHGQIQARRWADESESGVRVR